jgi:hypothetical protein
MAGFDMARLAHSFFVTHTGGAGAVARALPHLTPGTLAFLISAR